MHFIKAKTINSSEWGKVVSFGNSVQFNLELNPLSLIVIIERIEQKLTQNAIISLPKTDIINDVNIKKQLDKKLADLIMKSDTELQIEEFDVSGIDFVFSDRSTYRFYIKGDSKNKTDQIDLTIENLVRFAKDRSLNLEEDINDIRVSVSNELGRAHSSPVKRFLDYMDDDRNCLIDGIWHKFNYSYLQYINDEIDKIPLIQDSAFNIAKSVDEDAFNEIAELNHSYENIHKNSPMLDDPLGKRFKVERMDLYKDETLFFVKIGTPQKLGYVVDQSLNTIALLKHNIAKITINNIDLSVKNICLWLIIERETDIFALKELNSIIFLMKLADWRKLVNDAGYHPVVKVNYRR